jgi:general secretion pathway protein C
MIQKIFCPIDIRGTEIKMEVAFKKYFWTFNVIFLALAAWLLSSAVNVVIGHKLRYLPSMSKRTTVKSRYNPMKRNLADNNIIVDRNYFNSALATPSEVEEVVEVETELNLEDDGVESTLRASLVGTVVADEHPEWSIAMITDQEESETAPYRVDSELMGEAIILAIHTQRVIINHNGVVEYLELQEDAKPKHRPRTSPRKRGKKEGKDDPKLGEGIKKLGDDKWAIERGEIDKTLSNLNTIAMQARIVPSFKNGESNGFKLFAIRPGSLYSKLGIQNGDIIHKINGYPMNSPDKALEIYQKLKNARSIDIELTRRGKSKKLNYQIQ